MNVLLFTADDMNWDTPSAFGGRYGPATPTIDAFADTARCFRHAHVTVAVCLPSRSTLMTGRYPHHNGSEGFVAIHPSVPTLPEHLKDHHGYRTGIIGKVQHCCPPAKFRWDHQCDYADLGFGRDPRRYAEELSAFLDAGTGAPFFVMVNSHDPHRPFHGGDQANQKWTATERQRIPPPSRVISPDEVTVPGFLPDIPEVRREVAEYASSCRRCDDTCAATLRCLEERELLDDTVIIFLSDNGMAFPFAKTNCYLHSTRTPLMIRWPGRTLPGMDETHLINGIDLLPTICDGLGIELPSPIGLDAWMPPIEQDRDRWRPIAPTIDGRSYLPLLAGGTQADRDHLFTVFNASHKATRYDMRCVQTRDWGLIYNAWSNGHAVFRNESCGGRTFKAMQAHAEHDAALAERVRLFQHRVPEECYAFGVDPDALANRVDDPQARDQRDALRHMLRDWLAANQDPLLHDFDRVIA